MLINESYFDDLKIEDEDILNHTDDLSTDFESGLDFLEYCELHYTDMIELGTVRLSDENYVHPDTMRHIQTLLDNLFDLYGIDHSELFIKDTYDGWDNMVHCYGAEYPDYKIYDYGFKYLACENPEKERTLEEYSDRYVAIYMYFNMPPFNENRAFRFLYKLLKTAFRPNPYNILHFYLNDSALFKKPKYQEIIELSKEEVDYYKDYNDFLKKIRRNIQIDDIRCCICRFDKDFNKIRKYIQS